MQSKHCFCFCNDGSEFHLFFSHFASQKICMYFYPILVLKRTADAGFVGLTTVKSIFEYYYQILHFQRANFSVVIQVAFELPR